MSTGKTIGEFDGSRISNAENSELAVARSTQPARHCRISVFIFCVLAFSFVYAHQRGFGGPTSLSRLDLLHALHVHHTLAIDAYHTNTMDKAFLGSHYYSDKAPGTAVVALPFFCAAAWILGTGGISVDSSTGWLITSWLSSALALGFFTAAGGVACFRWLSRYVPEKPAFVTTLGIFLGSLPLPYTTMMYSHAQVVALLFLAMWALDRPLKGSDGITVQTKRYDSLGGFTLGLALASEYTAGLIVAAIGILLFWRTPSRAVRTCFAAVPVLLLIPLYSFLTLGDPLSLPYSYQASFPTMREGLYAIKWPDLQTGYRLLFGSARGLFFWSPFLLLVLVGFVWLYVRSRRLFYFAYLGFLIQVAVISGRVWDWQAGPGFGARYLAPALVCLALPCALAAERLPKTAAVLAGVSIGLTSVATLTAANLPVSLNNPLWDFNLEMFTKGDFNPNIGTVLGLKPFVSVALYYIILVGGSWWIYRRLPRIQIHPLVYQKAFDDSAHPRSPAHRNTSPKAHPGLVE